MGRSPARNPQPTCFQCWGLQGNHPGQAPGPLSVRCLNPGRKYSKYQTHEWHELSQNTGQPHPLLSRLGNPHQCWKIGPAIPQALTLGWVFRLLSPKTWHPSPPDGGPQSHTPVVRLPPRRKPCCLELQRTFRAGGNCMPCLREPPPSVAPWPQTWSLMHRLTPTLNSAAWGIPPQCR